MNCGCVGILPAWLLSYERKKTTGEGFTSVRAVAVNNRNEQNTQSFTNWLDRVLRGSLTCSGSLNRRELVRRYIDA